MRRTDRGDLVFSPMKLVRVALRREWLATHGIGCASFGLFLVCFFALLHWHFPIVGHDYHLFFNQLLEGAWLFHHSGLDIPRYSVHVCGGSVLYGNPQDMFYSPAQFLSLILGPWFAIQSTILVSLIAGYVGWYRAGRDLMRLSKQWSHVLALVIQANGFYFMHLMAGHVTFHAFTFLGWFFLLLLDRNELVERRTVVRRTAAFALLCAYVLYSGNWIVLLFLGIGLCLVLPLDLFLAEDPIRRLRHLALRFALFGAAALMITSSKLVAIASFMRILSGEAPSIIQDPSHSALWLVAKALWGIPQSKYLLEGMQPEYIHEKSMLIAPVTLFGLFLGGFILIGSIRKKTGADRIGLLVLAGAYGGAMVMMMVQLVRGNSWIAEAFHELPLGVLQRISTRYLYLFSLLLSVAGIWALAKIMEYFGGRANTRGMLFAAATTVAAFFVGYVGMLPEVGLWPNVNDHRDLWRRFDRSSFVAQVVPATDFVAGTGRTCYEPILNAAGNPSSVLHVGSVWDRDNGYFNLMNPACYQYPEENSCKPGDRIAVDDAENLMRLTRGLPVTWKVSHAQQVADVVSSLSLLLLLVLLRYPTLLLGRRPGPEHGGIKEGSS